MASPYSTNSRSEETRMKNDQFMSNVVEELGSDEERFDMVVSELSRSLPYPVAKSEHHAHCAGLSLEFMKSRNIPALTCERLAQCTWHILSEMLNEPTSQQQRQAESGDTLSSSDDGGGGCMEADIFVRHTLQCVLKVCQNELTTSESESGVAAIDLPTPPIKPLNISQYSIRNSRRKMEDRHLCLYNPGILHSSDLQQEGECSSSTDKYSLFCVFDGHGGNEASTYAYHQYPYHLVNSTHYPQQMGLAITEAFSQTELGVLNKANQCNFRGGSCAAVVVLNSSELHVGWLGDCQVLLVSDDQPVNITPPHKPDNEEERKRIESVGGCVVFFNGWRVNGSIAVARAIGDKDFKPFISPEPSTISRELTGEDEAVILACDGLFDSLPAGEISRIILENSFPPRQRDTVAETLVRAAKEHGSTDNITVIVIWLKNVIS